MGQKTHPNGFRLITTQKHLSSWYSKKSDYPILLEEDYFIRETLTKNLTKLLTFSKIEISRTPKTTQKETIIVNVYSLYPRAKEMYKKLTPLLARLKLNKTYSFPLSKATLRKVTVFFMQYLTRKWIRLFQVKTKKNCIVKFKFIKNPFTDAVLIAKYMAGILEKRVAPQRVIKQALQKALLSGIPGIKIQISGRLNGAERARSDCKREGKVPLHTLRAKIDYTYQTAKTMDGILGIKVWLFNK